MKTDSFYKHTLTGTNALGHFQTTSTVLVTVILISRNKPLQLAPAKNEEEVYFLMKSLVVKDRRQGLTGTETKK